MKSSSIWITILNVITIFTLFYFFDIELGSFIIGCIVQAVFSLLNILNDLD